MNKVITTICLVLLLAGTASATTPLGPPLPSTSTGVPTFQLTAGAYDLGDTGAIGVEYAEGQSTQTFSTLGLSGKVDVETNLLFATYYTPITDDLELVVRAGGSEMDPDGLSSNYGVAAGFGVKWALPSVRNIDLGLIAQCTWMSSEYDLPVDDLVLDIVVNEIQIALGTEHVVNDHITLYGGPFVQFLSGSGDIPITEKIIIDVDMESTTNFGGFLGAEWELDASRSLYAELQLVGEGHSICGGFLWKF